MMTDEAAEEAASNNPGSTTIEVDLEGSPKAGGEEKEEQTSSSVSFKADKDAEIAVPAADDEDDTNHKHEWQLRQSKTLMGNLLFHDHHTLKAPSNVIKYEEGRVRVYGQRNSQFVLEERHGDVTAKVAKDGSVGLSFLRLVYTVVALLMTGFLLIFCLQLLLFLFLALAGNAGLTSETEFQFAEFAGTLLSVPVFVYSLACALAIAASFVADTWGGHTFVNTISQWKDVSTQWFSFIIFLAIPLMVAICALFAQSQDWWPITALTWFSAVFAYYCLFAAAVVFFEITGCLELVRRHPGVDTKNGSLWRVLQAAVLLRQQQRFSGKKRFEYLVRGTHEPQEGVRLPEKHLKERSKVGLYSKFTTWPWLQQQGFFELLDEPVQLFTIDEVQDIAPYVTSNSWSLEKLCCRSRNSRFIAVVNGRAAVTPAQVKSSFYCSVIGNIIVLLTTVSLLIWFGAGTGAAVFCGVVVGLFLIPSFRRSFGLYRLYNRTTLAKKQDDLDNDEVLYQVWDTLRITRANPKMCWTMLGFELLLFYLLPLITLFSVKNYPIAILFVIMGFVSLVRFYLNAPAVLRELGTIDVLDEDLDGVTVRRKSMLMDQDYREKNRLNLIIGKISQGRRRNVWIWVFTIVVGVFCILFLAAFGAGSSQGKSTVPVFLPANQFVYNHTNQTNQLLPYPTCRMGNGLEMPGSPETALADYTFLSALAYIDPGLTQQWLDAWFENGPTAVNSEDEVQKFRTEVLSGAESAVSYKLITFPVDPDFAVVAIRGTSNGWDALTDAQLWSAAAMSQYVRALLPLGEIWTPILQSLVKGVSLLESDALDKVAYYKQTTQFVEYVKSQTQWTDVRITGHSLGGGLSMITGAQTETPAIAVSGPNNMISRKTFDPPLTEEELDTYTFNIVPEKDPVPRIDDLARLYQRVACTADNSHFVDCHTATRTLCEILFTCGNNGRPTFCFCTELYGYPKPTALTNLTYDEACAAETSPPA